VRDGKRVQRLSDAADSIRKTDDQMQDLVRLLARSRKVELDIVASQFGGLIAPPKLAQIMKDLEDIEARLGGESRL
jgi:hypothetical protein